MIAALLIALVCSCVAFVLYLLELASPLRQGRWDRLRGLLRPRNLTRPRPWR